MIMISYCHRSSFKFSLCKVKKDHVQGVTKDEVLIGSFFALTGGMAYGGLGQSQGAELYFNEVNAKGGIYGRRIKLLLEDDACQPIKGVTAVNKLLTEKPFMLFGPTCSGVALAAIETIVKEGIPWFIYGVSTGKVTTSMRKNVFRASEIPDDLQAKAVVDYDIHNMKVRNIAIIYTTRVNMEKAVQMELLRGLLSMG